MKIGIAKYVIIIALVAILLYAGATAWKETNQQIAQENKGAKVDTSADSNLQVQQVYLKALANGTYTVSEIKVKKGVPVELHFTADPKAGCGRSFAIYGIKFPTIVSNNGAEVITSFTPEKEGAFEYNCSMRMWQPGKLVVVP